MDGWDRPIPHRPNSKNTLERAPVHHRDNSTRDTIIQTVTYTHNTKLELAINLTSMFLYSGMKLEHSQKTHTHSGRLCQLDTERLQLGFEPRTFLAGGNSISQVNAYKPQRTELNTVKVILNCLPLKLFFTTCLVYLVIIFPHCFWIFLFQVIKNQ